MRIFFQILFICFINQSYSQENSSISGQVTKNSIGIANAKLVILGTKLTTQTDSLGYYDFKNLENGSYTIQISAKDFQSIKKTLLLKENENLLLNIELTDSRQELNEVVISGTLKPIRRLESPVPVEVYSQKFLKQNPTSTIFEALQNVNGVRPQVNCGVCGTGDIRINGLPGAYTLVLIDGMPIVSSLSTVYGLNGIPNSLIERIEIVKGPASSLYGSEAVGGLINIITKNAINAPKFSFDAFSTSYLEHNIDMGAKFNVGKKAVALFGLNYFKFGNRVDNDKDNFTDVVLADRISLFQKWTFERNQNRIFTLAARGMYEDRFGGDMRWERKNRGGTDIYGESIFTKRAELLGNYQLPTTEKIMFAFSGNAHFQDSQYGNTSYIANQKILFGQLTWDKKIGKNDMLFGLAMRYNFYDDNTPATANTLGGNKVDEIFLPGIFAQNEITFNEKHNLLVGLRYDYNSAHGNIFTPRLAYRFKVNENNIIRLNAGTGFRVVNLFTEDHAALTGARQVVIKNNLNPETSMNVNLNYIRKFNFENGTFIGIETSAFYTHFSNRIINDYLTNPNQIIYDNVQGYATSKGITANIDFNFINGLKIASGVSFLDNRNVENGVSVIPILTERFSATWSASYKINPINLTIDYNGNVYGSMELPLLSSLDPRAPNSPTYSIQNIQLTYSGFKNFELYAGIKNLLNFLPLQNNPFLIANTNDPFDTNVQYDPNGQVIATPQNPYALTFDTSYVYAQNQGIRGFFGLRYNLR